MTFTPDKVSIVLPVYNGERFLRGAIDSCLSQTHRSLELIVVDDCSTDSTPQIVRSYTDPRLVYVRNETNQRLPRSLNIGFGRATGDYLTWTSDDNEYEPTAIERMLEFLKKDRDADFVCADYWAWDEKSGVKKRVEIPERLDLKNKCEVGGCFLYTRRVWQEIGPYDPRYEMVEDYDYWMRISRRFQMQRLAEPLYLYRYHSESLTARRGYIQEIWDRVLRYRHGFIGWQELGWAVLYNLENIEKSNEPAPATRQLMRQTWKRFWVLSPFFFWAAASAVRYCALRRWVRRVSGKEKAER